MDRNTLNEIIKQLNPLNFKQVKVSYQAGFPRNVKNRILKAKNVYNVINTLQKQNWTIFKQTDNEIILVGLNLDLLFGVYIKITYNSFDKMYQTEQVIIERSCFTHKEILNETNM